MIALLLASLLLATQAQLGDEEARLVVRAPDGLVSVRASPELQVAGAFPGGEAAGFATTPRVLAAPHAWRGFDGVVEVVLRRADAREPAEILLDGGGVAGVWLEWPAARRPLPGAGGALALAVVLAIASSGVPRRRRQGEAIQRPASTPWKIPHEERRRYDPPEANGRPGRRSHRDARADRHVPP